MIGWSVSGAGVGCLGNREDAAASQPQAQGYPLEVFPSQKL